MWHFEKILEGPDRGGWSHPYFIRGNKPLCAKMSRRILDQPNQFKEMAVEINKSKSDSELVVNFLKNRNGDSSSSSSSLVSKRLEIPLEISFATDGRIFRSSRCSQEKSIPLDGANTTRAQAECLDFAGRSFFSVDCEPRSSGRIRYPTFQSPLSRIADGEYGHPLDGKPDSLDDHIAICQLDWNASEEEIGPYDDLFADDDDDETPADPQRF